jgi:hypothetical protein
MDHIISKSKVGPAGFALVVTLLMLVMLTLIAVGLLSLSTISVRNSGHGNDQATARANARLALMLAIGDLQKYSGPDRRVTATSSILSNSQPNGPWVGVWRTDGLKGDPASPGIIRPGTTGYSDLRNQGNTYMPADQCLGWLVSGNSPSPGTPLTDVTSLEIRRAGAAPIRVPKVMMAGRSRGGFGYHISDESTKARVSLADPYASTQPDPSNPSAEGMRRWLTPQISDASVFFPDGTPLDIAQAAKITSRSQLGLSTVAKHMPPVDFKTYCKTHDDDFTAHGRCVLADPVEGGLKGDLTAFLESGTTPALGPVAALTSTTTINGNIGATRSKSGPKFGMLRNWYDLRNQVIRSGGGFSIECQPPSTKKQAGSVAMVEPGEAFVKPVIQPVMTEAVYYLNHVLDGPPSATRVVELIYPRVVLWNPFSVKMQTEGHVVMFEFRRGQWIRCNYTPASGAATFKDIRNSTRKAAETDRLLGFYIPPTVIEAGEALTFCAPAGDRSFNKTDLRANILSAAASPSDLGCFTNEWAGNNLGAVNQSTVNFSYLEFLNNDTNNVYTNASKGDGRTQVITLHSVDGSPGAVTAATLLTQGACPAVRQLSVDNYSRGNNERWLPAYTKRNIRHRTDVRSGNIPPDSLLAYGARFRFQYETYSNRTHGSSRDPWFASPLGHHNINAPNVHRWPCDNLFGMRYASMVGSSTGITGGGFHLYSYGHMAQARQWSEWLDPEVMPRRGPSGKFRTAVFNDASFATSDSIYPVYDLPLPETPLVSLGALQHVPLSPFVWHPTYAIGNSFPSPCVPLANQTSNDFTTENQQWSSVLSHLSPTNNIDITGFEGVTNEVLMNDLSFELNHALWDRYFLSAIPRTGQGWQGGHWNPAVPLPNSRLTVNSSIPQSDTPEELADFHRAARSLWLEGGFNVNSTSVNAWRSLLHSFRSVQVPSLSATTISASGEGASFPGHLISNGSASPRALDASTDRFWRDFRNLSNAEIDTLAVAIVDQVRQRAPFLGVADFVNRRLGPPTNPAAYGGAIQAALDRTSAINDNGSNSAQFRLPTPESAASQYDYGMNRWGGAVAMPRPQQYAAYNSYPGGPTRLKGASAASQITQADILQQLGPVLVARGDTFVIRACGEAHDSAGKITAKVWCEAVVQRTPVPITPDPATNNLNPLVEAPKADWGRRYVIESFRWLDASEI